MPSYLVTHGIGPAAIDQRPDLDSALALACQLLAEKQLDVAIQDGRGNRISGPDLVACCKRDKQLTPDLKAQ